MFSFRGHWIASRAGEQDGDLRPTLPPIGRNAKGDQERRRLPSPFAPQSAKSNGTGGPGRFAAGAP